ncbi:hypothetical protein FKM82_022665 [Ascaphus truei]
MAASMLNRVCVTLRGPRIPSAVTRRHPQYSTAPVSRGNRSPPNFRFRKEPAAPRTSKMQPDQDWNSVYPTAAVFKPSTVPLPVRMGYPIRSSVPPDKTGNLELVKVKEVTSRGRAPLCAVLLPSCFSLLRAVL